MTEQIKPADARTFVANFHPDPEAVKAMPDDQVLKYHERVNGFHSKAVQDAVEAAKKGVVPQTWPENWRKEIVEDEKELPQIERYQSPKDVWRKARELEKKLSSGEYKRVAPFPEKGTPEEQAQWRKDAGIPEAPDKYEFKPKNGAQLSDDDKAIVADFAKYAHAANMAPGHFNATVQWLLDESARGAEEDGVQDEKDARTREDKLRSEWGQDFRRNENLVANLLATAPAGLADLLGKTRLADGTLLKNSVDMQRFLVQLALQVNPVGTVLPGVTGDVGQAVGDEIAKLEKMMGDKRSEYWKGPKADELQKRYRDLIDARNKVQKRAA